MLGLPSAWGTEQLQGAEPQSPSAGLAARRLEVFGGEDV